MSGREGGGRKESQAWRGLACIVGGSSGSRARCEPLPLGGEGLGRCPLSLLAGACTYWQEMLSTPAEKGAEGHFSSVISL